MQKGWAWLGKITSAASKALINALVPRAAPLPLATSTSAVKAISRIGAGRSCLQAGLDLPFPEDGKSSGGYCEPRSQLQGVTGKEGHAPAGQEVAQALQQMGHSSP